MRSRAATGPKSRRRLNQLQEVDHARAASAFNGGIRLPNSISPTYWKIGARFVSNDRKKTFNVKLPFSVSYKHIIKTSDMSHALKAICISARASALRVNGSR